MSDKDKEAEGQLQKLPGGTEVSAGVGCWWMSEGDELLWLNIIKTRTCSFVAWLCSWQAQTSASCFRGDKQECKYFDQLMQIFGSKYMMTPDPLTDDTADVVGKRKIHQTRVTL